MKNKCNCGTGHFGYHEVSCAIHKGYAPEAVDGNRCCCGKYSNVDAGGFISNCTQHMPINTGSFCGPVDRHIIATLHDKIKELEGDKERLDFVQEHVTRLHFDDACDSLIYSDQKHFGNCQWLRTAIDKARK